MLLVFYCNLARCQSVAELANNTPKIHEIFRGPRSALLPPGNLLNKNPKIIINQFIEVTFKLISEIFIYIFLDGGS